MAAMCSDLKVFILLVLKLKYFVNQVNAMAADMVAPGHQQRWY